MMKNSIFDLEKWGVDLYTSKYGKSRTHWNFNGFEVSYPFTYENEFKLLIPIKLK